MLNLPIFVKGVSFSVYYDLNPVAISSIFVDVNEDVDLKDVDLKDVLADDVLDGINDLLRRWG